jgi:hypothetical protein
MSKLTIEQMITWNHWLILGTIGYLVALIFLLVYLSGIRLEGLVFSLIKLKTIGLSMKETCMKVIFSSRPIWRLTAVLLITRKWMD